MKSLPIDALAYWTPICDLVCSRRCWVRLAATPEHGGLSEWGHGLGLPTPTYLEGPGGPVPLTQVEWLEIATERVRGGLAGRPIEIIDVTQQVVAALSEASAQWHFREATWAPIALIELRPLRVICVTNPFFTPDAAQ